MSIWNFLKIGKFHLDSHYNYKLIYLHCFNYNIDVTIFIIQHIYPHLNWLWLLKLFSFEHLFKKFLNHLRIDNQLWFEIKNCIFLWLDGIKFRLNLIIINEI